MGRQISTTDLSVGQNCSEFVVFHLPKLTRQVRNRAEWQRPRVKVGERTFAVWKSCLGILDCLLRSPVYKGNFPLEKTKHYLPFTTGILE